MHINELGRAFQVIEGYSLYLNEIRKNLAANLAGLPGRRGPALRTADFP